MTGLRSTAKARWSGDQAAIALLVAALVAWSVGVLSLSRGHTGNLMDDGLYFVSAQALRGGRAYTLPSQPGPPIRARYPIGLSALVALALRLAPGSPSLARDFAVGRAVIVAAGWVFLVAAYVWLRQARAPAWVAFLVVVATAFHPVTIGLSAAVVPDVPFAAYAWVSLARWAARRPARSPAQAVTRAFGNGVYAPALTLGLCLWAA